jgi:hypothetical protein
MQPMNNENIELKGYIEKYKRLFRYQLQDNRGYISSSLAVETVLNADSMEAVKEFIQLMGIENVAKIFFDDTNLSEGKVNDYYTEPTLNYFTLLFKRYAC